MAGALLLGARTIPSRCGKHSKNGTMELIIIKIREVIVMGSLARTCITEAEALLVSL